MQIVVFLKQVLDNTKLKAGSQGPEGVDFILNPFDEYALETALRLKESAGGDATVTAISLGGPSAKEILKKAIATGADAAYHLEGESPVTAAALAQAVKQWVPGFSVLLFGQFSLDAAAGQTGPQVAALLGVPSLTFCKAATLPEPGVLHVARETERGLETHALTLPGAVCMIKCDYELRSANIKGVMKANKTEIPVHPVASLALQAQPLTETVALAPRPAKASGVKIDGSDAPAAAAQLVAWLQESKVL